MTGSGPQSFFRPLTVLCRVAALIGGLALASSGMHAQAPASNQLSNRTLPQTGAARLAARKARTERFLAGRQVASRHVAGDTSPAQALEAARRQHLDLTLQPRDTTLSAPWSAVGPAHLTGTTYGYLTGRVTALALDPADATGNTLYVGTTGGGVWKSTNAAGSAAAVTFAPLTDTLPVFSANAGSGVIPSLSIGALVVSNGIVLAGTGDTNDATDSYYGAGILRSSDGGLTWTLVQSSTDGAAGNHTLVGLGFAAFAASTANPALIVAAASTAAEGTLVNAPGAKTRVQGLYYSADAGISWHLSTLMDGNITTQSPSFGSAAATSVVWNPVRQAFFAAIQYHGYYSSPDGITWTRLTHQPGTGLTAAACPASPASSACPLFRGALAVQPLTGDTFALTVDSADNDAGLYQDTCALTGTACASATVQFATRLNAAPLETGSGSTVIAQAGYNLELLATPLAGDTALYAGTIDLYRCTLAAGCTLRNTTDAENGCLYPAGVAPAQHALASRPGYAAFSRQRRRHLPHARRRHRNRRLHAPPPTPRTSTTSTPA